MPQHRAFLSPTPQQQTILRCDHKRLIIEANAGAAKTTTAALKIQHLITRGASPQRLLVLTYTEPGCEAARQALSRVGVPPAIARQVGVFTFDEFTARRLAKIEGQTVRPSTAEQVKPYVLKAIAYARASVPDRYASEFQVSGAGELAVEGFLNEFRHLKGTMQLSLEGPEFRVTPSSAAQLGRDCTTLWVYYAYEKLRLAYAGDHPPPRYEGDATYDLARTMLEDDLPPVAGKHLLALGLELIVVDEMHDMNRAMFTVLKGPLSNNGAASFLGVGDVDQVIHAEAGARADFMRRDFDVEIGSAERLPLDSSLRFGSDLARMLSHHASKAYASRSDRQTRLQLLTIDSARDTALAIDRGLKERHGLQPESLSGELAVLLRHPCRSVELENELLRLGVDYRPVGFDSYLRRPEVLFARGILSYALNAFEHIEGDATWEAIRRATRQFFGTADDGFAQHATRENFKSHIMPLLLQETDDQSRRQIEAAMDVARTDRVDAFDALIDALDVRRLASRVLVHATAIEAVDDSIRGLAQAAKHHDTITSFLRVMGEQEMRLSAMRSDRCIRLSTIEAAKGLEFDHVFVPNVNSGEFDGAQGDDRNLFYVAASRTRHLLTLTHRTGRPSTYLASLDELGDASAQG